MTKFTITIKPERKWWQFWIPQEIETDVSADVRSEWQSDGIGAYEYWGHNCYDAGESFKVHWIQGDIHFDREECMWGLNIFQRFWVRHTKQMKKLVDMAVEEVPESAFD